MRRGSFKLMKKMNQKIILKLIHDKETISRAEIAEITALSPATVSNIVKELLAMNLVQETTRGESRGGRKPILLEINPSGAFVIGFEWGIAKIKAVLLNLGMEIVDSRELFVSSFRTDNYINYTVDIINSLTEDTEIAEKIFGVGIGIHGLVNPEKGISLYAPHFNWQNISIKKLINDIVDYPILLDNDVRMMALAEKWEGRDNFIFINTGPGIGSAIVFAGNLLYGRDWSAGEFGHMKVVEDGPVCSCGNHGCLEALISLKKLVKDYKPQLESDLSYRKLKKEWGMMINEAASGDIKARDILIKAGKFMGTGIANLVNLLNPEAVIIGGAFIKAADILFPVIKEQVIKKSLKIPGQELNIIPTQFAENVGAVGAGTQVLQEIFKLKKE